MAYREIELVAGEHFTIGGIDVSIAEHWHYKATPFEINLAFDGPRSITVDRAELHEAMKAKRRGRVGNG